jgi:hypothetical protein
VNHRIAEIALAVVVAVVPFISTTASAQTGDTAVAAVNTPVFIAPDTSKDPLRVAAAGTSFVVLGEEGTWTRVQFQDPQWGRRVGYVATKDLRVRRPSLEPMDLSVRPEAAAAMPQQQAPPPLAPVQAGRPTAPAWADGYGTLTAPLVGIEAGSQVLPVMQVYGAFDWHRDISPQIVDDLNELLSDLYGADLKIRLPAYTLMAGVKVTTPRGSVRPYGLGGFGYGRVNGKIAVEGRDVTGLLDSLGVIDKSDIEFNKMLFEVGGGMQVSKGSLFVDIGYRFRKFLQTGTGINVSGVYAGAGVGF